MTARDVVIAHINEGERHRHDMGDIKSLADSMTEVGLLHPVVVTEELNLIAGGRRMAAARALGWIKIPANVVSNIVEASTMLQAETDENTCRKDFTPTEAAKIKQAREALLKPLARDRQGHGQTAPGKNASAKLAEASPRPRDVASRGTGYSRETLRKVETVQKIVENPATPEPVRAIGVDALAEMDKTSKVDAPAKRVSEAEQAHRAVVDFPELSFYTDRAEPEKAIRLAITLRGLSEPELTSRRENLRRRIAADQQVTPSAPKPAEPDYSNLAEAIFDAINNAARVTRNNGGADTVRRAAELEDALLVNNWRGQYEDMAQLCTELTDALKVTLRRVK